MAIKTEDHNGKFSYETTIADLKPNKSMALISIPYAKIKERNISKETKLKITIEILE